MSLLTRPSTGALPRDAAAGRHHPPPRVPGPLDRIAPGIGALAGAAIPVLAGHAAVRRSA